MNKLAHPRNEYESVTVRRPGIAVHDCDGGDEAEQPLDLDLSGVRIDDNRLAIAVLLDDGCPNRFEDE